MIIIIIIIYPNISYFCDFLGPKYCQCEDPIFSKCSSLTGSACLAA